MRRQLKKVYRFCTNLVDAPFVILIYHRVTKLPLDPQLLAVTPKNFNAQLIHLKENYHVLNIDQFTEMMVSGKKPHRNSVVITFDDGYADNLLEAIPILEKFQSQALFYITTSKLSTSRELWWDELERLFLTKGPLPPALKLEGFQIFKTETEQDRQNAYNDLHPLLKNLASVPRDAVMDQIVEWSGREKEGRMSHRLLTHQELLSLSKSTSAIVGAHTHNHPKLSVCSPGEQQSEISTSKEILEGILGRPVDHFSYPFGSKDDFTKETAALCAKIGFKVVCANNQGPVHSWHSKYALPRMLVRNWEVEEFENSLRSFFHY